MLTWPQCCALCVCAAEADLANLAFISLGHMHESLAVIHTLFSYAHDFYIQQLQSALCSSLACMNDKTCHDVM
jgi:hypothetical protein